MPEGGATVIVELRGVWRVEVLARLIGHVRPWLARWLIWTGLFDPLLRVGGEGWERVSLFEEFYG